MVDYSKYKRMKVEKDRKLATVTLTHDWLDLQMHNEVGQIWLDLAEDEDVNAILLTGTGSVFSYGGDYKDIGYLDNWGTEAAKDRAHRIASHVRRIIERLLDVEQPIIVAINGDAASLAANIALMCDIIVMSETARIVDDHVSLGLVAGDGGSLIWPLLIGPARAKECLLRSKPITGTEAQKMGLVNYAVPQNQVLTKAREIARELADGPTWAIRWSKLAVNKWLKQQCNLIMDSGIGYEMIALTDDAFHEGLLAWEKRGRKPNFEKK